MSYPLKGGVNSSDVTLTGYDAICMDLIHKFGDFLGGSLRDLFQSHSKGIYKDPNDCMNHPK